MKDKYKANMSQIFMILVEYEGIGKKLKSFKKRWVMKEIFDKTIFTDKDTHVVCVYTGSRNLRHARFPGFEAGVQRNKVSWISNSFQYRL